MTDSTMKVTRDPYIIVKARDVQASVEKCHCFSSNSFVRLQRACVQGTSDLMQMEVCTFQIFVNVRVVGDRREDLSFAQIRWINRERGDE